MVKLQQYAKFIAALLTVLVTAGVGLIPSEFTGWIQLGIALLGAFAVYQIPNAPTQEQKDEVISEAVLDPSSPVTLNLPEVGETTVH